MMKLLRIRASLPPFYATIVLVTIALLANTFSVEAQQIETISYSSASERTDAYAEPTLEKKKPVAASQVLLIVDPDCKACDELLVELEKEFQPMRASNWKIDRGDGAHIRIINKDDAVALLKMPEDEAKAMKLPKLLAIQNREVVRYFKSGCSTPLDRWTFDWMFTGVDKRPTPPPIQPITVATSGNYPLRGGHWSVEGDWHPSREKVLYHLQGPAHAAQLRPEWKLETWSREELRSLHDNLHELVEYGRTNVYSSNANAPNYVTYAK